ncbi:hypothetical protein MD484_g789, partial [Candolleomyces efflorescens]
MSSPSKKSSVGGSAGRRSTRNSALGASALSIGKEDVPKTPSRTSKRGRVSDAKAPSTSPSASPTKKLRTLQLDGLVDNDSELSELEESDSTLSDTGKKAGVGKKPVRGSKPATSMKGSDDPFAAKPSLDDDEKPVSSSKEVHLEDLRPVIRCTTLPSSDGVPHDVRDTTLHKMFPDMPQPFLVLGLWVSWMSRDEDSGQMRRVILNYMSYYQKQFPGNGTVISNISAALSSPFSGCFYNAACADPRNFVSKQSATSNSPRFELYSKGGAPVIGITVGTSVVDGKVDFQTMPKPDSFPSSSRAVDDSVPAGMESYTTLTPSRTKKVFSRHVPSTRPYAYDDPVPILDATKVLLDLSPTGLSNHVRTLPAWEGEVPINSPCMVGYTIACYSWDKEWRFKLYTSFVIVLAVL